MKEPILFRDVKLSRLMLEPSSGQVYYEVSLKFFPEVEQSLKISKKESADEENLMIGKQLVEVLLKCRNEAGNEK